MMLRLIDKGKIYFYIVLLLTILSIHNINFINSFNNYFKISKIEIYGNLNESLNDEIENALEEFYNVNIFSLDSDEISYLLNNFNIISEYKIKKKYPSALNVELKETTILAYFFENNLKTYIGENGKKIKKIKQNSEEVPIIIGQFDIKNFLNLKKLLNKNGFKINDFDTLYYFKSKRWDLVYKKKTIIKLPSKNLENSINLFKEVIENHNSDEIEIIDLRIKDSVILS